SSTGVRRCGGTPMTRILLAVLLISLMACPFAAADDLTARAITGDEQAMKTLRAEGPAGLRRLLDSCPARPDKQTAAAIDAVAAQKDAFTSKLYWYTDLDQAKAAAAREHKPILS